MILSCTCHHPYSDKHYGKGKRVHNRCEGSAIGGKNKYRCTACGNLREFKGEKRDEPDANGQD